MKPPFEYRPTQTKARSSVGLERGTSNSEVAGSSPAVPAKKRQPKVGAAKKPGRPSTGFDRGEYQRLYMADLPKAKALGLTVKQYRDANSLKGGGP
jgi:hypothetical protein